MVEGSSGRSCSKYRSLGTPPSGRISSSPRRSTSDSEAPRIGSRILPRSSRSLARQSMSNQRA